ncbi:MAG: outer membrane beta-barrel protein [Candidatus Latescibacterota bacterium]|nr:MAG: outer membrane beta-barrel protein [Candidatus Latescibacterota bacterium]
MSRFCLCLIASCLCFLVVSNAAAQSDLGLKGAGLEVGFVDPQDVDATLGFGVFVDLGTIVPRVKLDAHLDYWSKSEEQYGIEASVRDIAVGAKAKYLFEVPTNRIRPFAGGGVSIHFVSAEVTIPDQNIMGVIVPGTSVSDSSTKLGLDLGGGFYAPLTPKVSFVTEMWVGIVSDVNQLSLKIGLLYNLGS